MQGYSLFYERMTYNINWLGVEDYRVSEVRCSCKGNVG